MADAAVPNATSAPYAAPDRIFHVAFNAAGCLVNLLLFVYLLRHRVTGRKPLLIFRLQSIADCLVCTANATNFLQLQLNYFPLSGVAWLDHFLCSYWYNTMGLWWLFTLSAYSLSLMALDRLLAVYRPIRYKLVGVRWYRLAVALCALLATATTVPWAWPSGVVAGSCDVSEIVSFYFDNPAYRTVIVYQFTVMVYPIPLLTVLVAYSLILRKLCSKRTESDTFANASVNFTKMMVGIGVVFVLTQTFPALTSFVDFSGTGTAAYAPEVYDWAMTLTAANSAANPFIFFGDHFARKLAARFAAKPQAATEATETTGRRV